MPYSVFKGFSWVPSMQAFCRLSSVFLGNNGACFYAHMQSIWLPYHIWFIYCCLSNLLSRALLLSEFLVVEECEELICSPIKWNIICRLKILNKFFQVLLFHFLYAFIIVVHNL